MAFSCTVPNATSEINGNGDHTGYSYCLLGTIPKKMAGESSGFLMKPNSSDILNQMCPGKDTAIKYKLVPF